MKRRIFRLTMKIFVKLGIAHKVIIFGIPCEVCYSELPL